MKTIKLPVSWEMSGFVSVEAESVEAAIEHFHNNIDHIQLPQDSEYTTGSFSLSSDEVEFIEQYN